MTRRPWAVGGAALVAALAVVLTACSSGGTTVDQNLTAQDAKAIAQGIEDEIVALIPAEYVAEVAQQPEGVLMQCTEKGSYQWAGGTVVTLQGEPDVEAILTSIEGDFAAREGFTTRDATGAADTAVQIVGPFGAGYLFGPEKERTLLTIDSFSPCFVLGEGESPNDSY